MNNNPNEYNNNFQNQPTTSFTQPNQSTQQTQLNTQTPLIEQTPSNPNLKSNKMIIGIIVGILIVGAIVAVFLVSSQSQNKEENNNKETTTENAMKEGTAKLVLTETNTINGIESKFASNYFSVDGTDFQETIVDKNGKKLFTARYYKFLSEKYVLYHTEENGEDNENKIYDLEQNKVIFSFDNYSYYNDELSVGLKDNTLFYNFTDGNGMYVVAHDLKNNKELWKVKADMYVDYSTQANIGVRDNFLLVTTGNYTSKDVNKTIFASSILSFDGKLIVEGNKEDASSYITEFDKQDNLPFTYVLETGNYIVTKANDYVQTYDINGNKLATISLKEENYNTKVTDIFHNDTFVVWKYNKENLRDGLYTLYNIKGEVLATSNLGMINITGSYNTSAIESSNVSALSMNNEIVLLKDNKIVKKYLGYQNEKYTGLTISSKGDKNNFLIVNYRDENDTYIKKLLNLNTLEEIDIPLENVNSESFFESPNGKYIILNNKSTYSKDPAKYQVYNQDMKLLYESSNEIYPIDDNFVIEDMGTKVSIVNVNTKSKKEVEIKGEFGYTVNQAGFVTSDETNHYLYTFK